MVAPEERPLAGRRILVPPARPEANPLLHILERLGAEALEFPALTVAPPPDYGPMDQAVRQLNDHDWIIFSGSNCVINFLKRFEVLQLSKAALSGAKICAIGRGAVSALKKQGVEIQYIPKLHTAEAVTAGLGEASGSAFVLVRVEGASRGLPQRLRDLGAKVTEVVGYRMLVDATVEMAERQGLTPEIVSRGHIADLAESLTGFFCKLVI